MRSIRVQFIAFILAVLMLLLVLLNIYPLISARDQIFEEKKASLSSRAAMIASSLGMLDSLSGEAARDVVSFLGTENLTAVAVLDKTGAKLYSTAVIPDEGDDLTTALECKTLFRSVFKDSAFSSLAVCPVCIQGEVAGAVGVYEYDTERAVMLLQLQERIRIVSLVIGGAALLIVIVFSEVLIGRIRQLVGSIKIVADGDYSHRLPVRGKDEIAQLGNEFNQLTERLDTTEKQRRRFVSDASHELKTPLASIRLLSDSITQNEGMDRETMLEFVTDIGNEAGRLQHTTEKLLDLSRLDDDVQVVPEPVDVKQAVLDAMVMLRPLADEKNVRLRCELDDGCVVMATADDMFHIVFNLMENAVKYNVPDGTVRTVVTSTSESVMLTVEDTGIGIPEGDRLNIFSRFYRVDKARSREAGGSGLGLSIVHDAVIAHGGSITVGANKPQGSRFTVVFPKPTEEETGI